MDPGDHLHSDEIFLSIGERPDLSGVDLEEVPPEAFFTPRQRITYSRFNSPNGPLAHTIVSPNQAETATFNEEMARVRNKVSLQAKIDKSVRLFNESPEQSFAFMRKENLAQSPRDMANFLLITFGLDKVMIGSVLGGSEQLHKEILQEYANIADFSTLEFDVALRCFLSRFRLPGEAQKIDRIVNAFAKRFYMDNPQLFPTEDTPYVLAFSLIMLNTDYHSPKIPAHRKMTKEQFVRNNREVLATLPRKYLEDMYDRITAIQLETKTEGLENVYKRLIAFSDTIKSNALSPTKQRDLLKSAARTNELLQTGVVFIKYPRKGQPRQRFFFFSEDFDRLQWRNERNSRDRPRFVLARELVDVLVGANNTDNFQRFRVSPDVDKLCFSLITQGRSIDLQAPSVEIFSPWILFFREKVSENADTRRRDNRRSLGGDDIEGKWEAIIQQWHDYWDDLTGRPRTFQRTESTGCLCFGRNAREERKSALSNAGYCLVTLWRRGVPASKRPVVWLKALGNTLQVSTEQYANRVDELQSVLSSLSPQSSATARVTTAAAEIRSAVHQFQFLQQCLGAQWDNALEKVLLATLLQRTDIEFTPGLMHLAAEFLLFLPEYESFVCFINLLGKMHFPALLSNRREQVQMRVQFFEQAFMRELRSLWDHFKMLSVKSDYYLLEWLATLFTKVLPLPIASHVWDVLFLDGEVYIIRVAVGILKYFQADLKRMSVDGIVKLLQCAPVTMSEEGFFEVVDTVQIDSDYYERQLRQVSIASEKSRVLAPLMNSR